jgi:hypothetical protein
VATQVAEPLSEDALGQAHCITQHQAQSFVLAAAHSAGTALRNGAGNEGTNETASGAQAAAPDGRNASAACCEGAGKGGRGRRAAEKGAARDSADVAAVAASGRAQAIDGQRLTDGANAGQAPAAPVQGTDATGRRVSGAGDGDAQPGEAPKAILHNAWDTVFSSTSSGLPSAAGELGLCAGGGGGAAASKLGARGAVLAAGVLWPRLAEGCGCRHVHIDIAALRSVAARAFVATRSVSDAHATYIAVTNVPGALLPLHCSANPAMLQQLMGTQTVGGGAGATSAADAAAAGAAAAAVFDVATARNIAIQCLAVPPHEDAKVEGAQASAAKDAAAAATRAPPAGPLPRRASLIGPGGVAVPLAIDSLRPPGLRFRADLVRRAMLHTHLA